jgi:hypothetical protein
MDAGDAPALVLFAFCCDEVTAIAILPSLGRGRAILVLIVSKTPTIEIEPVGS